MRTSLPVVGYAASGDGADALPAERVVALRPRGSTRGGGRLPRLGVELAQSALRGADCSETTGVFFGTALGCLTETEMFVAHMLREHEATPKPRAFSASVHNAIGSFVAMKLGARGECHTYVHGEVSFAQALFAASLASARHKARAIVGALDEAPAATFLDLAHAAGGDPRGEGGAVLIAGDGAEPRDEVLAHVTHVAFSRPLDAAEWARAELEGEPPDALLSSEDLHPSSLATATARAVGILAGEIAPGEAGLEERPSALAVLASSSHGEAALIALRRS